jgi:DNA-directed RNA polymerase specialized sigma24 family protein
MDTVTRSADSPTFEEYAGGAWPSLYRCAYLLAGNHADAEDIAQQTLSKATSSPP